MIVYFVVTKHHSWNKSLFCYICVLSFMIYMYMSLCMSQRNIPRNYTVYPKKYAHGFVVLCFVVVMQSFIMNSHEVFIHIHQGCFAGTGAIVRLPQCQWSKPDGYGKISQCITTTKHSKAKTVCIFLGIYCIPRNYRPMKLWGSFSSWKSDNVLCIRGPFYWHGLTLIPAWVSNYIHYKVWDETTYPFPNFNGATLEVWE